MIAPPAAFCKRGGRIDSGGEFMYLKGAMRRKTALFILIGLLVLFGLRFVRLGADPPASISISMGYMSDPGGYVHNARSKVLFDRWEIDNWNMRFITPIPHYLTYAVFRIFGPGIAQMNAVPALFACLTLLFFYFTLLADFGRIWAVAGTALLGLNYLFLIFSQVAVRAMPMLFFTVLALFFLNRPRLDRRAGLILAGAAVFLSFTAKGTSLFVLPALVLGIGLSTWFDKRPRWKRSISDVAWFGIGLAGVLAIWLLVIYLPHRVDFLPFGHSNFFWLTPHDGTSQWGAFLWGVLKNFWHRPLYFFLHMPVVTLLASLTLTVTAYRFFAAPRRVPRTTWIMGLWAVSNLMWFAIIQYRPGRHLYPLVVPLVWLAVQGLRDFAGLNALRKPARRPLLFFVFLYGWVFLTLSAAVILLGRPTQPQPMYSRLYLCLALSLAATTLTYLIFRFWPTEKRLILPAKLRAAGISALIGASLIVNLVPFGRWAVHARSDRRTISRDLGQALPPSSIGGLVSMVLSLENEHRPHAYKTDYINRGLDFIDRYGITHLLITRHAEELKDFNQDFPQHMKHARLLVRYPLWRTQVELYDIRPRPSPAVEKEKAYQGEIFWGRGGIPRFDPAAEGGFAFCVERAKSGSSLELSAGKYPAGKYRVAFRMRTSGTVSSVERICRLDVIHEQQRRLLARRDLNGSDCPEAAGYSEFEFPLSLNKERSLTLRLHSTGRTEIWLDRVVITRVD